MLRHWGEMLARHHASPRRPYARGWARVSVDDDVQDAEAAGDQGAPRVGPPIEP